MENVSEKDVVQFIHACHRIASYGLVRCSSGNLSWRVDREHVLITATHTWMSTINQDGLSLCRVSDGAILNEKKPSAESVFHFGLLRKRSDINVVLHFQSPCATALACSRKVPRNFSVIPEIPYYIGPVSIVPYEDPGSVELAKAVITALQENNLALLKNHGQVTVGKDFNDVMLKASFFELACEILLHAGEQIQYLSEEAIAYLSSHRHKGRTVNV